VKRKPVPVTLEHVAAARRDRRCICGIRPEHLKADSQAIILSSPGDGKSTTCPECGRERRVVRVAFPIDR
jgi:hypothetical protein